MYLEPMPAHLCDRVTAINIVSAWNKASRNMFRWKRIISGNSPRTLSISILCSIPRLRFRLSGGNQRSMACRFGSPLPASMGSKLHDFRSHAFTLLWTGNRRVDLQFTAGYGCLPHRPRSSVTVEHLFALSAWQRWLVGGVYVAFRFG